MRANLRRGIPLVVYIHPGNLESRKEQVADPTMRDRISQYAGSGRGLSSFRQVIRNFRFSTIEETFSKQIQQLRSGLARR